MKRLLTFIFAVGLTLTLTSCIELFAVMFSENKSRQEIPIDSTVVVVVDTTVVESDETNLEPTEPNFEDDEEEPDDEPSARDFADDEPNDEPEPNVGDGITNQRDARKRYPGTPTDVVVFREKMSRAKPMTYRNPRFGYSFSLPSCFVPLEGSQNGDGQRYLCEEVVLSMSARHNALNETVAQAFKNNAFHPTYKVVKPSYYIASGTLPSGEIYYEKCTLRDGDFITIHLAYPKRYQHDVEGIISDIAAYRP